MVYIGLGSNLGNRFETLQKAVDQIAAEVGTVESISRVYETPAWGFESEAFLNACIQVNSKKNPFEIIEILLSIETKLGRKRIESDGYQARSIDLDIVLYKDQIINEEHLQIPHPRMEIRQFVLTPLADIAAKVNHPILNRTIEKLQQECADKSNLILWGDELKK